MTHERSDFAWQVSTEAAQKFDYFMVGLAAALAGYLGQQLELSPVGLNASTLELLAVLLFGCSMVAGVWRLESTVTAISGNHLRLHGSEATGALVKAARQGGTLLNEETGEIYSASQALARARAYKQAGDALDERTERFRSRAHRAYRWRNWFLYAGMLSLVASRLWEAYA